VDIIILEEVMLALWVASVPYLGFMDLLYWVRR